jgi:proteasome accessory factor C
MVTSGERLRRMLALVPYVMSRRSVPVKEAAERFGMSERELISDLNLVWCVELKSPDPYCPIDLSYEGGEISVSESESIVRPLRLDKDEVPAMLTTLRWLEPQASTDAEADAIRRTIDKLEEAVGTALAAASGQIAADTRSPEGAVKAYSASVRQALAARCRLHLRYYVPARDETTERDVDPMRLLVVEGRSYLEGWCYRAEETRRFRLDRILDLSVLDVPVSLPEQAAPADVEQGLFRPSESDLTVELELEPGAQWVPEYYPCESVAELGEGRLRITLRTPDPGWVRRLALRLGDTARVVSPPELSADVRDTAAAALAQYAE